jgi:hypothetical protein
MMGIINLIMQVFGLISKKNNKNLYFLYEKNLFPVARSYWPMTAAVFAAETDLGEPAPPIVKTL